VSWSPAVLDELARQALLRYLAVAHFGRGRGAYEDREHPEHWQRAVDRALEAGGRELTATWKRAQGSTGMGSGEISGTAPDATLERRLRRSLEEALETILRQAYPASASVLGG
jgi:hypothetical protein